VTSVRPCEQQEGDCPPPGWRVCCIDSCHQGPQRVLTHLARLTARYPSPAAQEKLTYLQKREAHLQYPTRSGQQAGLLAPGASKAPGIGGCRGTPQRGRHALGSAERQPYARAPQCGLQSPVARDLGDVSGSSTSASHESATSRHSAATSQRLLVPRLLGSTGVSAVSSTCSRCNLTEG
jgi:hypothetical protein